MSETTMWIILAASLLCLSPFLFFLWAKMWASGWKLGQARARERIKNDNLKETNHKHERKRQA